MPVPANRFSDLTADVQKWLADVTSPNKPAEIVALRNGALGLVEKLTKHPDGSAGEMSSLSGVSLEMGVIRAVQASNSDAVKPNGAAWQGFGGKVGTYAGSALGAKKLNVPGDWAELLQAFAAGLQ